MGVSVVIPLYNKEEYIGRTIESVIAQTFQDFEILVVNDGSTDSSATVVRKINDSRIKLIDQVNGGPARARNTAIMNATGEWIAFLDADDIWLPEHLESHMALLNRNPGLCWSAGNYYLESGSQRKPVWKDMTFLANHMSGEVVKDVLITLPYGSVCSDVVIVKRSVFAEVGYMDPALRTTEDVDMWLRIALRYPQIAYCAKPTAIYHIEVENSLSSRKVDDPLKIPHFLFARKHLSSLPELPENRRAVVAVISCKLMKIGIKKLLLLGYSRQASSVIDEFKEFLGNYECFYYKLLTYLPTAFLRASLTIKQLLSGY